MAGGVTLLTVKSASLLTHSSAHLTAVVTTIVDVETTVVVGVGMLKHEQALDRAELAEAVT